MSKYLLNIKPTNLNLTNCFIPICTENAFATYLDYIYVEYHYAFANATIFDFSKDFCDTGRIADGIFTGYDFMKQLKDTYDISVYKKSFGFLNLTSIKDISLMHKQSYERLLDCLACETSSTSHNISTNFTMSIPIDLTPYCNNKGFAQGDLITIPCDLTGAGEYYKIDSCYNLSALTIDKMKYYINLANKYDNIICNNDTITIEPPVNAVGLSILCCSEWGKANDIIRIIFADNSWYKWFIYIFHTSTIIQIKCPYNIYTFLFFVIVNVIIGNSTI